MRRLRRVISKQSTAPPANLPIPSVEPPLLTHHRSSKSFSVTHTSSPPTQSHKDWRVLRDASKHKRTASSILPSIHRAQPSFSFIGYPVGGLEIKSEVSGGLVLVCTQPTPDVCQFVVSQTAAGLRVSDLMAIGLVSWAAHIFFRGPALLALLPIVVYLVRSASRVCQESLVVVRNVGIQTETVTLAGFRTVKSFELPGIEDLIIHEALQMFEYRYYMAILPRHTNHPSIMFPNLLPRLDILLPVYHGCRQLLFA